MCPSCKSSRIVQGRLTTNIFIKTRQEFRPKERKMFTTSPGYIDLDRDMKLCVDCGLVWTSTDPISTRDKLKEILKKETLEELKLK